MVYKTPRTAWCYVRQTLGGVCVPESLYVALPADVVICVCDQYPQHWLELLSVHFVCILCAVWCTTSPLYTAWHIPTLGTVGRA